MSELLVKIANNAKDWLAGLALAAIAALSPIHAVMITVGVLIGADLIVGIMAAHKRGEAITSAALRRTVSKLVVYQVAVISAFLVEKYLMEHALPVAKLVGSVIGLVELRSLSESFEDILGYSVFSLALKQLGSVNDTQGKLTEIAKEVTEEPNKDKNPSDNK